jgi:hypothetical protein
MFLFDREGAVPMYFADEAIQEMSSGYQTVHGKLNNLVEAYILQEFKDTRAREHASHGFTRRLKLMVRCIDNVFQNIPPDRSKLPSRDELSDATINIQSFVFNIFGSIDNLAWIWVSEMGQKRRDGTPIPDTHIGLGPDNSSVRFTLSEEFQAYLKGLDKWFEHLSTLRHALAHRIPLYIPPYVIAEADEPAYRDFEAKMNEAIKRHQFDEYDRLSTEQMKLGRFRPWVQHSFEEGAKPVVFHPQMLADFNTVDELGHKMLEELDR